MKKKMMTLAVVLVAFGIFCGCGSEHFDKKLFIDYYTAGVNKGGSRNTLPSSKAKNFEVVADAGAEPDDAPDPEPKPSCVLNADCKENHWCIEGRCIKEEVDWECATIWDCKERYPNNEKPYCNLGKCVAKDPWKSDDKFYSCTNASCGVGGTCTSYNYCGIKEGWTGRTVKYLPWRDLLMVEFNTKYFTLFKVLFIYQVKNQHRIKLSHVTYTNNFSLDSGAIGGKIVVNGEFVDTKSWGHDDSGVIQIPSWDDWIVRTRPRQTP